jgi:hypothetical protein
MASLPCSPEPDLPPHAVESLDGARRDPAPRFPAHGWAGLALIAFGEICLFLRIEPFRSWFFILAWYGYILFVDAAVFRLEGASLIRSRRKQFFAMLPLSTLIWVVFEGFNVRLRNWEYQNLIEPIWLLLIGFAVAFATVLPGLFETADLLRALAARGRWRILRWRMPPWRISPRAEAVGAAVGLAFLLLPLIWPRCFFPLVWLGFVPILEPFNRRLGAPSLYADLARGDPRRVVFLLLGGFVCGGLWEFWNFWACSRWAYHIPFADFLRLFEMPLLGFFGFPPFTLECFAMYAFLLAVAPCQDSTIGAERAPNQADQKTELRS